MTSEITNNVSLKRELNEIGNDDKCKKVKNEDFDEPILSKRQKKKILKQQKWLETKAKRKEFNKEKKKERKKWKADMKAAGHEIIKVKTTKMKESSCKTRIVLDMSYDHLMSNKDLCKCSNQILRCYGLNRRMKNPMQLYFCSFEGKVKETMLKHNGYEYWDINYIEESFDKIFNKEELVYLTSDSNNILNTIDENKVYVIGGLVDHNSCKGASLNHAEQLGISHARLPINEYIDMKTRKILTINHVYEVISKVVSGDSWKDALVSTLPKRKIFSAKCDDSCDNDEVVFENLEDVMKLPTEKNELLNKNLIIDQKKKDVVL
ncbi:tRNA methyltransferase 10 homolog A [Daktulosphaira vitifoliae]|uniref:tRNA methyltransferase 10 homolog A n=1 Tax=Daktulosphaira vitifoliae TaxID=58002 RepID=UPI0021AA7DDE|nr:tRNA methyltransferase 10 homolog A [Daktulosphaira vitifoliae]